MKFFVAFAAILALAFAKSRSGIYELSEAIQNPNTDPAMIPYLEAALNELMIAAISQPAVQPAPVVETTVDTAAIDQLLDAIHNPNTDPAMLPFLEAALSDLLGNVDSPISPIPVVTPWEPVPAPVSSPVVLTSWSLQELSEAIQNPNTDPALLPHLESGLDALMSSLLSGDQQESIVIAIPAHLVPITQEVAPVAQPAPVQEVVAPAPVAPVASESSPLVQIIVNVNREAVAAPVAPAPVVPSPVVLPTPVPAPVEPWVPPTRPEPEHSIVPVPTNPVDGIAIMPPQVPNPIDVIAVAAPETNPIDVVAVAAPETNPIDVVAISAPEVNPIDMLMPMPAPVVSAVGVIGPLL